MSALGAVTGIARVGAAAAPASATANVHESGVRGIDLSGDPLTDLVLRSFAADPIGTGSLDGAMDRISASFSFDPANGDRQVAVPGTGVRIDPANALTSMAPSAAARMPVSEFLARSESTIAKVWHDGLDAAEREGSPRAAYLSMADGLTQALRPDATGRSSYDYADQALEVQKQEQVRKLKERVGDPREVMAKLMSLTIAQGMVGREREKSEELLKLLISLILGVQIPKGTVERLVALGMGDMVRELIQQMLGDGKGLSKGMQQDARALGSIGVDVSIVSERDSDVGMRDAAEHRARNAVAVQGGRVVDPSGHTLQSGEGGVDLGDLLRRRAAGVSDPGHAGTRALA